MSLTAIAIKNARPQAKPYKLTDERALFLLVMPNGAKYWRMHYRYLGKQKTLSLGVWPEVSLAEAREKRDAARKQVANGLDPMAEKKLKRIRAQIDSSNTFKAIAEEWVLNLLAACKSVKVKRLFFLFADRHNHSWLRHIDRDKVDLGKGPRSLVEGGSYVAAYQLVVPGEFAPARSGEPQQDA